MVIRMMSPNSSTRRAQRLLRWYPAVWKERYGEEFVDHMEQEITETPRSLRRTLNVIGKGLSARMMDLGVVGETLSPANQFRNSSAMSLFAAGLFGLLALNLWSTDMLAWNAGYQWSVPMTVLLAVSTIVLATMVLLMVALVITVLVTSVKRVLHGDGERLRVPLAITFGSSILLGFSIFENGVHPNVWPFLRLGNPGFAIKQVAAMVNQVFSQSTYTLDGGFNTMRGFSVLTLVGFAVFPFALLALTFSIASLIRRTEFADRLARLTRILAHLLPFGMLMYLLAIVGVAVGVGGRNGRVAFIGSLWSEQVPTSTLLLALLIPLAGLCIKSSTKVHLASAL